MQFQNTYNKPELKNKITDYCNRRLITAEPWDQEFYQDIIHNIDSETVYCAYDEQHQTVKALLSNQQLFGVTVWHVDGNLKSAVLCLKEAFPEALYMTGDGYTLRQNGLHATVCHASRDKNVIYPVIANAGIWTNKENLTTVPRDWLEAKYIQPPAGWQERIEYQWVESRKWERESYDKELMDYPWEKSPCGHYSYIGFHYMNHPYVPERTNFLMARVDNKPIGCICITQYFRDMRQQEPFYAVQYIDVCLPYKRQGVAKKMIHELTKYLPDDGPLLISMESEEGRKCHITECFKREQWPHSALSQKEFDELRYKSTAAFTR